MKGLMVPLLIMLSTGIVVGQQPLRTNLNKSYRVDDLPRASRAQGRLASSSLDPAGKVGSRDAESASSLRLPLDSQPSIYQRRDDLKTEDDGSADASGNFSPLTTRTFTSSRFVPKAPFKEPPSEQPTSSSRTGPAKGAVGDAAVEPQSSVLSSNNGSALAQSLQSRPAGPGPDDAFDPSGKVDSTTTRQQSGSQTQDNRYRPLTTSASMQTLRQLQSSAANYINTTIEIVDPNTNQQLPRQFVTGIILEDESTENNPQLPFASMHGVPDLDSKTGERIYRFELTDDQIRSLPRQRLKFLFPDKMLGKVDRVEFVSASALARARSAERASSQADFGNTGGNAFSGGTVPLPAPDIPPGDERFMGPVLPSRFARNNQRFEDNLPGANRMGSIADSFSNDPNGQVTNNQRPVTNGRDAGNRFDAGNQSGGGNVRSFNDQGRGNPQDTQRQMDVTTRGSDFNRLPPRTAGFGEMGQRTMTDAEREAYFASQRQQANVQAHRLKMEEERLARLERELQQRQAQQSVAENRVAQNFGAGNINSTQGDALGPSTNGRFTPSPTIADPTQQYIQNQSATIDKLSDELAQVKYLLARQNETAAQAAYSQTPTNPWKSPISQVAFQRNGNVGLPREQFDPLPLNQPTGTQSQTAQKPGLPSDNGAGRGPVARLAEQDSTNRTMPGAGVKPNTQATNQGEDKTRESNFKGQAQIMYVLMMGSMALNVFLLYYCRTIYVRFHELGDEIRETFTSTA